jgi:hypothetical protein
VNAFAAFAKKWAARVGREQDRQLMAALEARASEALRVAVLERDLPAAKQEARAAQSHADLRRALERKPFVWKLATIRQHGKPVRGSSRGLSHEIWESVLTDVEAARTGDGEALERLRHDAIALIDAPPEPGAIRRDRFKHRAITGHAQAIWVDLLEQPYWIDFKPVQSAEFKLLVEDLRKLAGIRSKKGSVAGLEKALKRQRRDGYGTPVEKALDEAPSNEGAPGAEGKERSGLPGAVGPDGNPQAADTPGLKIPGDRTEAKELSQAAGYPRRRR